MTWTDLLFYCTFVSQIFLISFYVPEKLILRRMKRVIEDYPPDEYPKLYPGLTRNYRIEYRGFKVINRCIFVLGFVILFAVYTIDQGTVSEDGFIPAEWPAVYGIIQFIPLVLLEFTAYSQFKLMRAANQTTLRKAGLRRRSLFAAVSRTVLVSTFALFVAAVLVELFANGFALAWNSFERSTWLVFCNLFMASIGARILYGRKQDPHQANADRDRQVKILLGSLCYASMALSIFYMTLELGELFGLDYLKATLVSAYFQVIVLISVGRVLRSTRIEEINFDVYKSDSAPA